MTKRDTVTVVEAALVSDRMIHTCIESDLVWKKYVTHACNLLNGHLAASLKGECAGGAAREEDQTKARGLHRGVLLLRGGPPPTL